MRLQIITILSLSFALAGSTAIAGPKIDMKPGLWRITAKMSMAGQAMPEMSHEQCLTKKDLVPDASKTAMPGANCKNKFKIKGNVVTWKTTCKLDNGGKTTAKGKALYSGTKVTGTVEMSTKIPEMEEPMVGTVEFKGKRIGACKSK